MKIARKFILALFALAVIVSFSACGEKPAEGVTLENYIGTDILSIDAGPGEAEAPEVHLTDELKQDGSMTVMLEQVCESRDGIIDLHMTDADKNAYIYEDLELMDGDIVSLEWDGDMPMAIVTRGDASQSYDATYIPATPEYELEDYMGAWVYDGFDYCLFFENGNRWSFYGLDGAYQGSSDYAFQSDVGLTLLKKDGSPMGTLLSEAEDTLVDLDGNSLHRVTLPEQAVPTAYDSLSSSVSFTAAAATVRYSSQFTCDSLSESQMFFHPVNTAAEGTNVGIWMLLNPISSELDPYLSRGGATAQTYMKMLARQVLENTLGSLMQQSVEAGFTDGGTYYSITTYMLVSGELFTKGSGEPLYAVAEVRYYGPTGYAVMTLAAAPESKIQNYANIASVMLNNLEYAGNWSTAPKPVPAKVTSKPSYASKSDSSNYGSTYYWYDADGDVWYWNGYCNEFIGFGDDYYIDDNGQYYESQDYDWDDYYNDYYGDNDWYYYDDYDPWSDPGAGDSSWTDPGYYYDDYDVDWNYYYDEDTGADYYWEDDNDGGGWYESNDAGWDSGDDYYFDGDTGADYYWEDDDYGGDWYESNDAGWD